MQALSPKQENFIRAIWEILEENKLPPTFSDLREKLLITNQAIYDQAKRLSKMGYITITEGKARGIKLTPEATSLFIKTPQLTYNLSFPISFSNNAPLHNISMIDSTGGLPANISSTETTQKAI